MSETMPERTEPTTTRPEVTDHRINDDITTECPKFWSRFGGPPEFSGKKVLEVGCGLGALSIDMAQKGAIRVVGIDILVKDIDYARNYVDRHLPNLSPNLRFTCKPIAELQDHNFDFVVSKDAFEHIIDVPTMLSDIKASLADSGQVYIGFSPLYHSPFGDHDRRVTAFRTWGLFGKLLSRIPWGHLILERLILRMHPKTLGRPQASMHDLNLNTMSLEEFRDCIETAGMNAKTFYVNQSDNIFGRILSVLRKIPMLEKYCAFNVYCILEVARD